jgi:hypothetical protein
MGVVCAYQMSKGELKDSNPAAFLIYKGKLYAVLPPIARRHFMGNAEL